MIYSVEGYTISMLYNDRYLHEGPRNHRTVEYAGSIFQPDVVQVD